MGADDGAPTDRGGLERTGADFLSRHALYLGMEVLGETMRAGGAEPGKAPPLLVRASEAAEMLALSPRKLWELTNCGEVPCVRIGRSVRYAVEDLRRLVEAWRQG